MKKTLFIIHCSLLISSAGAESFLTAESFPATFSDLSFTERMNVLAEGYAPFNPVFDETTGKCLSNCGAYQELNIEDYQKTLERNTAAAIAAANSAAKEYGTVQAEIRIPRKTPLAGNPRITSNFGGRNIFGQYQFHNGVDFAAPIGTAVYSPADGVVERIWTDDICGRAMRIKHSDGFTSAYCHLSEYTVAAGDAIAADTIVAKTGNTGRSTGPHLHYGIYYKGEWVNPLMFM